MELVKKLSNMTFREGFLIFPQASNECKDIKMYFFINFSINSSSNFFINIHIFTSLRTTERQQHRTAHSNLPSCCILTHNEHAPNIQMRQQTIFVNNNYAQNKLMLLCFFTILYFTERKNK